MSMINEKLMPAFEKGEVWKIADSTGVIINGYISNSMKNIELTIQTPKSMKNISNISVSNISAQLRGISGYVNGTSGYQNLTTSEYTVTATKTSDYIMYLAIEKSSSFTNETNNTPVSVRLNASTTFTFS